MEKTNNPSTASSKKCLAKNYKQYKINVRNEKFAVWEQFAESRGMSMRALMIEIMDKAAIDAGFSFEDSTEESAE